MSDIVWTLLGGILSGGVFILVCYTFWMFRPSEYTIRWTTGWWVGKAAQLALLILAVLEGIIFCIYSNSIFEYFLKR